MLKKLLNSLLLVLIIFGFNSVAFAQAGTISLTSARTTYAVGEFATVTIYANPNEESVLVGRAKFTYPQDLLEPVSWSAGSSLFPSISPANYVSNGEAYIGAFRLENGTTAPGAIGRVTFRVKATGTATLNMLGGTHLIDGDQVNRMGGSSGITLSLVPPSERPEVLPTAPGLAAPIVTSETHPDEDSWYPDPNAELCWEPPEGATGYPLTVKDTPNADPGSSVDTTETCFNFEDILTLEVTDGVWYFTVKAQYPSGYSGFTSYVVRIDRVAPNEFPVNFETVVTEDDQKEYHLTFFAEDETSGISHYELQRGELKEVKEDEENYHVEIVESPYVLQPSDLTFDTLHFTAVDKAGNRTTTSFDLTSEDVLAQLSAEFIAAIPPNAPYIYEEINLVSMKPNILYSQTALQFTGTAEPNSVVSLFFSHDEDTAKKTRSNEEGNWAYYLAEKLAEGTYTVFATAEKGGKVSPRSNIVQFKLTREFKSEITPNIILIMLLILLLLIILLFLFFACKKKKKKKKKWWMFWGGKKKKKRSRKKKK